MTFHKILCPIDFSPGSEQAMRAAVRLANEHDAALVLVHAWHVPASASGGEFGFAGDVVHDLGDEVQRNLDAVRAEAVRLGCSQVSAKVVIGLARQAIVELATDDPVIDLIVMGTRGRSGLARVLLGSVVEAVVRHAPCPVLVVRGTGEPAAFTRVLCPIDFSESSEEAMKLAAQLVHPGGAGIELLQVIETPNEYPADLPPEMRYELSLQSAAQLEHSVEDLAARSPVPVTQQTRAGRAGAQILAELDEGAFDLVVMGSHGRTGLGRMMLGSVSEKIARHAGCSVLVSHSRRAADTQVRHDSP